MMSNYFKNSLAFPKSLLDIFSRKEKLTVTKNNIKYNSLKNSDEDYAFKTHASIQFLNKTLRAIIENSSPSSAFDILLDEITVITNAEASALFIISDSGKPELIASKDSTQSSLLENYINQISIDSNYNVIELKNINGANEFDIKVIRLPNKKYNTNGVLLLKIPKFYSKKISKKELDSIKDSLSGILLSIHQADMSKKKALHEERALIARELHDSLAQSLSYLKIQVSRLQTLIKLDPPEKNLDLIAANGITEELRANLDISYKQLRELITTFRLTLNNNDLAKALEDSVDEFENKCSISMRLDNRLASIDLAVDEEIQVLQIVREAVSNIVRHSQAKQVEIILLKDTKNNITITIDDDGIGIDETQTNKRRHGMIIMQQRAHDLNGKLRVQSSQMGGTQIQVRFESKNKRFS